MNEDRTEAGAPAAEPLREAGAATDGPQRESRPVRRVGTFTCGITLVAGGVLLALCLLFPAFDLFFWGRFVCPAVFISLGCELLLCGFSRRDVQVRYDAVSMILCAVLVLAVLLFLPAEILARAGLSLS